MQHPSMQTNMHACRCKHIYRVVKGRERGGERGMHPTDKHL